MKKEDVQSNQQLLAIAAQNLANASDSIRRTEWSRETQGFSKAANAMILAINQTINVLDKVLEDLK